MTHSQVETGVLEKLMELELDSVPNPSPVPVEWDELAQRIFEQVIFSFDHQH
jgi:hypothetical protein